MRFNPFYFISFALLLATLLGCGGQSAVRSGVEIFPRSSKRSNPAEIERVKNIVDGINERNETIEKTQEWLKEAYSGIKLRNLRDIPKSEYKNYKQYLDKGRVYVIVHPSYYPFFENNVTLSSASDRKAYPSKNIVERYMDSYTAFDYNLKIVKEQERIMRSFIEFMSAEKKLIILVIPGNYLENLNYGYISGLDEYARYINEISNKSDSVIYIESEAFNYGNLSLKDFGKLFDFFEEIGVDDILIGGGYVGRCLDGFYEKIAESARFGSNIYYMPELSAVSPQDLSSIWSSNLMTDTGRLNFKLAGKNLTSSFAYDIQRNIVREIKHFNDYSFYPPSSQSQN